MTAIIAETDPNASKSLCVDSLLIASFDLTIPKTSWYRYENRKEPKPLNILVKRTLLFPHFHQKLWITESPHTPLPPSVTKDAVVLSTETSSDN